MPMFSRRLYFVGFGAGLPGRERSTLDRYALIFEKSRPRGPSQDSNILAVTFPGLETLLARKELVQEL